MSKDNFQWTDELALEFLNAHRTSEQIISKFYWKKESVDAFKNFKASHQPKEDKPEHKRYILKRNISIVKKGDEISWNPGYQQYQSRKWEKNHNECLFFTQEEIDRNPDWFEVIPEDKPEWEILEFKKNTYSYSRTNDGLYDINDLPFRDVQSKEELIRNGYQIHSVKRLSDGEVFSVGDEVGYWIASNYRKGVINRFYNAEQEMKVVGEGFDIYLSSCKKSKPKEEVKMQMPEIINTRKKYDAFMDKYANIKWNEEVKEPTQETFSELMNKITDMWTEFKNRKQ